MFLLKLAGRNAILHWKRNAVICTVFVFIGACSFLLISFSKGEIQNFQKSFSDFYNYRADIVCVPKGLQREPGEIARRKFIAPTDSIKKKILSVKGVESCAEFDRRIEMDIWSSEKRFKWVNFVGLDSVGIKQFASMAKITKGKIFSPKDYNSVVLNEKLATRCGIPIGAAIRIRGSDFFGQAVDEQAIVVGYFRPDISNPNSENSVFCDLNTHKMIAGFYENEASNLKIFLHKSAKKSKVLSELKQQALSLDTPIEFHFFDSFFKPDNNVYELAKAIILVSCAIIIVIAAYGASSVVSAALLDNKKEVATYYCLGAGRGFLIGCYTLESVLITLIASSIGISVGFLVQYIVNSMGISTEDPGLQLVFGGSRFALVCGIKEAFYVIAGSVVATAVASVIALVRVLDVTPSLAMKEERG